LTFELFDIGYWLLFESPVDDLILEPTFGGNQKGLHGRLERRVERMPEGEDIPWLFAREFVITNIDLARSGIKWTEVDVISEKWRAK
jgi:hypothetical protein